MIFFITLFNYLFTEKEHYGDVFNSVDMNRFDNLSYLPYIYRQPYDYFNGLGCNSPYCRNTWYNRYTPFVWNNPTRYPYYYPPLYTSILGDTYYY
jgi:hypothetical protein